MTIATAQAGTKNTAQGLNCGAYEAESASRHVDGQALADFRKFLEENKEGLKTGMGAFHTDGHSNW